MKIIKFIFLLILLTYSNAFAALSVVSTASTYTSVAGNELTVPITSTGSNHLIVIMTGMTWGTSVASITDGTNNFIQFPNAYYYLRSNQYWGFDVWYLPHSTSGKTSITINYNGFGSEDAQEWEVSGFTAAIPDAEVQLPNGATSGTTDTGAAVTPTGAYDFIVAVDDPGSTITADPASGNEFSSGGSIIAGAQGDSFCSYISSGNASAQPAWTEAGTTFESLTVAFKDVDTKTYLNNTNINNSKIGF